MKALRIPIVSEEEAEDCAYLVCVRKGSPTPFDDNLEAPCTICGETVIYRPSSPRKPPRICMQCAVEAMGATRQ